MKWYLWGALALLIPAFAQAQESRCPNYSMRAITHAATETAYTLRVTDQCALLVFQNTAGEAFTLPKPGANFPRGFMFSMFSKGVGTVTLTAATGTQINGASTVARAQNTGAAVYNDGTNWYYKP